MKLRIGVVGYSSDSFNKTKAAEILYSKLDSIAQKHSGKPVLVSGLTNIGVPKIAYEMAVERDWKTVGFACSKAQSYNQFPTDEKYIIGDEWGDESERFIGFIDVLLRVGGGDQSKEEAEKAREKDIPVYEVDLD